MADSHGWWKLTFLRKRHSVPSVLHVSPDGSPQPHGVATGNGEESPEGSSKEEGPPGLATRLEKMVDKSGSKGKQVRVSNSGRFKEKKKVRATLADNPNLCGARERDEK
ncbi:PR15L protein, partial [Rhinopomastus cyanomelas]|nr:PR15L protein [Rhinopomastus cyanomelas]